jgi:5-methyltetrahydrofolate--homocysteine methyltransferase
MRAANPDVPLISKANAGMPEWHGTELHYSGDPEVMAAHAVRQRDAGIQIIGACCGSSPRHLAMMRQVLDGNLPVPEVEFEVAAVRHVAKARRRTGRRSSRPER